MLCSITVFALEETVATTNTTTLSDAENTDPWYIDGDNDEPSPGAINLEEIDDITKLAVSFGAKALANIIYNEDGSAKSPVLKFVTEEQAKQIQERAQAEAGDIIFFVADKPKLVYDIM